MVQGKVVSAAGDTLADAAADGTADAARLNHKPTDGPAAVETLPVEKSAKDGKRDDNRDVPLSSPRDRKRSRSRERDRRRSSPAR